MRIGVIFPQTELRADPVDVRAYAQGVAEIGFRHIRAYDHVLGADRASRPDWPWPYDHESIFHEVFVLFGFLAGVVPGLELVSGVIVLPQRQTALVAKQAAQIDVLSGGRLRFGVGLGYNAVEFEALGMEFAGRGERFEEQVLLLRRLMAEPSVRFRGRWHSVTDAGINPLPVQRPVPIWIGGSSPRAVRRAARLGDGWFPLEPLPGRDWAATIAQVREWVAAAGRDAAAFGLDPVVDVTTGEPGGWAASAEMWRDLGATHLSVLTMDGGLCGAAAHLARLSEAWDALSAFAETEAAPTAATPQSTGE
ncbi:MAG TPA: LLM class F420-dependent oxidoreductase [Solirubrobacteraceae bacterium]|nr:LLM class F420-dependent oxidoreductase [Solirubrobacteraceae bacterium]